MKIIQITDLHIYHTNEIVNGVDTHDNFIKVLKEISTIDFDMLVITGDLCFSSGDKTVYQWIKNHLDIFNINNYYIIGGNHDNASELAEIFNLSDHLIEDELYYFLKPNIIFLDTIKGYCNENQLKWFKEKIKAIKDENPIIFMHHPAFKSGVPHMDNKYAFKQAKIFSEIFKLNEKSSYIFCGHYHNEITLIKDKINQFITPSTYLQINMMKEEFEIDHRIPAFRIIDIDNKQIKTTIRYVFD